MTNPKNVSTLSLSFHFHYLHTHSKWPVDAKQNHSLIIFNLSLTWDSVPGLRRCTVFQFRDNFSFTSLTFLLSLTFTAGRRQRDIFFTHSSVRPSLFVLFHSFRFVRSNRAYTPPHTNKHFKSLQHLLFVPQQQQRYNDIDDKNLQKRHPNKTPN